jgi:hypothetical protein
MAAPRPPVFVEPDLLVVQREHARIAPEAAGPPGPLAPLAPPAAPAAPAAPEALAPPVAPAAPDAIDLRSLEHPLEVVETGSFARAVCQCGWVGPARRSRAVATEDGERHPES